MKIISGLYRSRMIDGFDIVGTRPTMERVKESLFAMIQDYIKDSVVLDLFSGSGNLGIEALSNGSSYAYLVDNNNKAISVINNNISKLRIDNAKSINMDYKKALLYFKDNNIKFDIIFLDPPYKDNYIEVSNKLIDEYNLLRDGGIIVCESSFIDKIVYNNFKEIKSRKYGDKYVVILQKC